MDSALGHHVSKSPNDILSELGAMLSPDEQPALNTSPLPQLIDRTTSPCSSRCSHTRRILGMDSPTPSADLTPPAPQPIPSVFKNYLLVRPVPSLSVVFTSPSLRIPGLLHSNLLDRIAGPAHVRQGLLDAFAAPAAVTAKVAWTPVRGGPEKERWLHCTPLGGADDEVGVWMVLMFEREEVTGRLGRGVGVQVQQRDEKREVEREWAEYLKQRGKEERV